ncbi:MAG: hypothetical protein AB7G13_31905, partial [Lautropia sp.]
DLLRLASQERIAQMDRKADKIVEELRQSIADLASEVDGEFEALKRDAATAKVKEDADRKVRETKTVAAIEKKIASVARKTKPVAAKPA